MMPRFKRLRFIQENRLFQRKRGYYRIDMQISSSLNFQVGLVLNGACGF